MRQKKRLGSILFVILAAGLSRTIPAGEPVQESVLYDLKLESRIVDDCLACDRPTIEEELIGSFILTRVFPAPLDGENYKMTDVSLRCTLRVPGGRYMVTGSGNFSRYGRNDLRSQTMRLDVEIDGVEGIVLEGGPIDATAPWPEIDIEVSEDGTRDPLHMYSIRVVAAPREKPVHYELQDGSIFIDDCTICGRPTIPVPIAGTFTLTQISIDPDPVKAYRVDALDFRDLSFFEYRIQGNGRYEQGGEVALRQSMELDVSVNEDTGVQLASGQVNVTAAWPAIDIELAHQNPASPVHVYSLHIIAKPSGRPVEPPYRRGDSNGDADLDISDAVHILIWRFSGGAAPGCLDAADTNDDEMHDLTDAVYLLMYLFQGGPPPPSPGPESCGQPLTPSLGCNVYPPC